MSWTTLLGITKRRRGSVSIDSTEVSRSTASSPKEPAVELSRQVGRSLGIAWGGTHPPSRTTKRQPPVDGGLDALLFARRASHAAHPPAPSHAHRPYRLRSAAISVARRRGLRFALREENVKNNVALSSIPRSSSFELSLGCTTRPRRCDGSCSLLGPHRSWRGAASPVARGRTGDKPSPREPLARRASAPAPLHLRAGLRKLVRASISDVRTWKASPVSNITAPDRLQRG